MHKQIVDQRSPLSRNGQKMCFRDPSGLKTFVIFINQSVQNVCVDCEGDLGYGIAGSL